MDAVIALAVAVPPWAVVAVLGSLAVTLVHYADEWYGSDEAFWQYADPLRVMRSPVPFALGSFVLLVVQTVLALYGLAFGDAGALSLLVGLRLGDLLFSHIFLALCYRPYEPQPGLKTAGLLGLEAAAVALLWDRLTPDPMIGWLLVTGIAQFALPWLLVYAAWLLLGPLSKGVR